MAKRTWIEKDQCWSKDPAAIAEQDAARAAAVVKKPAKKKAKKKAAKKK